MTEGVNVGRERSVKGEDVICGDMRDADFALLPEMEMGVAGFSLSDVDDAGRCVVCGCGRFK